MIGNKRNFPSALVVPNFDALQKWARENGAAAASTDELVRDPRVIELYDRTVRELTAHLAQFERIKKIALLPREFSLEAGELTPTLKVKRRVVEQKYKDVIDRLYEGVVVRPLFPLSTFLARGFDLGVIDRAVNGLGSAVVGWAAAMRRLQTGYVVNYALTMLAGAVLVVAFLLSR